MPAQWLDVDPNHIFEEHDEVFDSPDPATRGRVESADDLREMPMFNDDEEDEDGAKKRKVPLVKLDFSTANSEEKTRERLGRIRESVPHDRETLFKAKVRWDGLSDVGTFSPLLPCFSIFRYQY